MFRNQSVNVHQFSMVPHAQIPRSAFKMQTMRKTTFNSGYLIPFFVEEVLPGDTFNVRMTAFCRLATPIFPFMDNLYLESFFFFVPNRLVWDNWVRFMGEQDNPADSISYVVPTLSSTAGGYAQNSIFDYMGLPTIGQVIGGLQVPHSVLPLRAYNLIFNQWFRDENLVNSAVVRKTDGGDLVADFPSAGHRRGKRHDYFTACLPWTQKGGVGVPLPLGGTAPVRGIGWTVAQTNPVVTNAVKESGGFTTNYPFAMTGNTNLTPTLTMGATTGVLGTAFPTIFADLSAATAATVNQLRQAFQIQKLLERDARGGTRYTELVRSHFGVISPDARLQRPEYLGGGTTPIAINPVAQTSATGLTGGTAPQGNLAAVGTGLARGHGFSQSFTEHGHIIGLLNVRADLTYQQGLRRMWSRSTRYDFYFPVFAMLGEQAVLNKEIYCDGTANDNNVFGYQERWAEYRYNPSQITGFFKSTATPTLDPWHLAQKFTALPTLNATFISETPPVQRVIAVAGVEFLCDAFMDMKVARAMPMYSVPGMIDHF